MRAIRILAAFLMLITAGAAMAEEAGAPAANGRCAGPSVSLAARPAALAGPQAILDSLFAPQPRPQSSGGIEDCPPAGLSCVHWATGDCLPCYDDFGQRGKSICESWRCAPSGVIYTCCSECERFAC